MRKRHHNRKTFADHMDETRDRADDSLFKRAQAASQLAKIATGDNVRRLYATKHRALHQLVLHHRVRGVRDWRPGYINMVSIRMGAHHRLHCPMSIYIRAIFAR